MSESHKPAIKIDTERLDKIIEDVTTADPLCQECIAKIKGDLHECTCETLNLLLTRVSEIIYERGVKDGIGFLLPHRM